MANRAPSIHEVERLLSARPGPEDAAYRARFVAAVERGLTDVAAGRVVDDDEVGRELDEELGPFV
jgi:predicted transcriptional regulator